MSVGTLDSSARAANERFWEHISSDNPQFVKKAEDAVDSYIRMRMREDGFTPKILPPIPLSNADLDRQVDTDKPTIVIDKEPNSPAAVSVPYGSQPFAKYIRAPRFRVMFDRVLTPKFMKDVAELRTYDMDVRQILSDNAIKDMLTEQDGKFIATVNSIVGTIDTAVAETGVAQYQSISGGITRDSVNDALKIMPSTPAHLETATILCNNITIKDVQKWGYDEIGGELAEEILRQGFAERNLLNTRWLITIQTRLVPTNQMYFFAEAKCLGKFFTLEEVTMHIKREAFMLEFFAYMSNGAAIANTAGVARVLYT